MNYRLYIFYLLLVNLFACTSSKEIVQKKIAIEQKQVKLPDSLIQKQSAGIDFFAGGDLPVSWTVEMDFDNRYYFKTTDGISMSVPAVKATRPAGTAASNYHYSSNQGDMTILVFDAGCSTNASGKKVEVTVNNTRYSGCGSDLYNASVNDVWILEKTGNTLLNSKDFPKGLPKLAFSIAENKMTGSDGCNAISAGIQMMGSRIKFSAIGGGDASCKNNAVQKIFMEKISNNTVDYYFKDGKLYLYLIDDSTLVFRKG
jgi:heat shock protein HslJ